MKIRNESIYKYVIFIVFSISASCGILKKETTLSERRILENSSLFVDALQLKLVGRTNDALDVLIKIADSDKNHSASRYEISRIYAGKLDYTNALLFVKQAIKIDPQNKWYRMLMIDIYDRTGDHASKIPVYNQLLRENPGDMSLHYGLTNAYVQMNDVKSALKVLNDIEEKIGVSEEVSIQKYQFYIKMHDNSSAIEEIKKLSTAFPQEVAYKMAIGDFYLQTGNYYEALTHYTDVYSLDSANYEALISMAECYMRIGNTSKATDLFSLLFIDPAVEVDAKMNIILYYYEISESDTVMKFYAYKLLDLYTVTHHDDAKVYSVYADFLFRDGNYEAAAEKWRKVVEIDPSKFTVWEHLFMCYDELKEYEKLYNTAIEANDLFPEQAGTFFYAGYALFVQKKYLQSIDFLQNAVDLAVTDKIIPQQALGYLAEAYHYLENHEMSYLSFEKLLEIDPDNIWALNNFSYYLALRNKNLEKALKMSEKTLLLYPKNPSFLDTYGWILYQMGNYTDAEKYMKQAVEFSQQPKPLILQNYGDVLMKLGRDEESIRYWRLSIEAGGNEIELLKRIEQSGKDE